MTERAGIRTPYQTKILVVDDEKRIRDGCRKMLTQEGFEVAVAENGFRALKMISEEHFDIILLDLMMSGVPGMEVLIHVRSHHPDTVIIVITGYATLEHAIEAMKKGAFDFIPKPFSPQDLRVVVVKAIEYIRTLQDISNEKSRMRVLINHLSDGVMATDKEKRVALANPAFLKMLGHQGDRVIGSHVSELVQNERLNEMIDQALAMPVEEFAELTDEFQFEDRAGNPETILGARCVPFRDRLNRNLGTVTLLQDITTLKKMEQIKSDFVSMVAHEIRSPMNSVLMLIKVILKGRAGHVTEKQEEMLDRVSEKIKSLVNLASELLDLAKIESGLIMQEQERLNIGEILTEQVAFHQTKAQEKDILLELIPISEPAFVLGNHYNMEEVISNLVGNAIKYTPAGGKIWVSTTAKENHHCICVRDTGIGMSREDIERIFERFYRVKNEKTRNIGGTGLGLAIVKSIVEAHNGIINVESKPDRGSAFKVYIPTAIHSD